MRLARINSLLFAAIIVVNLYIICAPLLPALILWTDKRTGTEARLHSLITAPTGQSQTPTLPGNRIIIPGMALDAPIIEGRDARALHDGPWRRPKGSTPDKGGNTVIAAHRFTYTQPKGSFYHLNILKPGDEIGVFWLGVRYRYQVTETKTVPATESGIEAPTTRPRLTLYTCTPLWLPKDRLVVIATPIKEEP